jgi:hypothetical protein
MARKIRASALETRTDRLKLKVRRKPYHFTTIAPGVGLGYRRGKRIGAWVVRVADGKGGYWTKNLPGIPDDHEDADGVRVLSWWQALDEARKLALGTTSTATVVASTDKPITVADAVTAYKANLVRRGGRPGNATRIEHHLTHTLAARPVALLTSKELEHWRDHLEIDAASTVNRTCRQLKAALNLAARHDPRIRANAGEWKYGLSALREDPPKRKDILPSEQLSALVAAAHTDSLEFGLFVEVGASTAARPCQLDKLEVGDLQADRREPRLLMPSSRKGAAGKPIVRTPVPIPASLAKKLQRIAAGRDASEPLLLRADGKPWVAANADYAKPFSAAVEAAKIKASLTFYCLRHTSIVSRILAGVPTRAIAAVTDTSTRMIEKHYSAWIADPADALLRQGMFDAAAPAADNVVALTGTGSD